MKKFHDLSDDEDTTRPDQSISTQDQPFLNRQRQKSSHETSAEWQQRGIPPLPSLEQGNSKDIRVQALIRYEGQLKTLIDVYGERLQLLLTRRGEVINHFQKQSKRLDDLLQNTIMKLFEQKKCLQQNFKENFDCILKNFQQLEKRAKNSLGLLQEVCQQVRYDQENLSENSNMEDFSTMVETWQEHVAPINNFFQNLCAQSFKVLRIVFPATDKWISQTFRCEEVQSHYLRNRSVSPGKDKQRETITSPIRQFRQGLYDPGLDDAIPSNYRPTNEIGANFVQMPQQLPNSLAYRMVSPSYGHQAPKVLPHWAKVNADAEYLDSQQNEQIDQTNYKGRAHREISHVFKRSHTYDAQQRDSALTKFTPIKPTNQFSTKLNDIERTNWPTFKNGGSTGSSEVQQVDPTSWSKSMLRSPERANLKHIQKVGDEPAQQTGFIPILDINVINTQRALLSKTVSSTNKTSETEN